MTKSEFDDAFLDGNLCIVHKNKDEWAEICGYAATLGVEPQSTSSLPNGTHDPSGFPYAYVRPVQNRISARNNADRFECTLSFEEFCSAINNDETVAFHISDLNEVL